MIKYPHRDCYTVQQARAYMVYIPEPQEKVIIVCRAGETLTLQASLVHPITKHVYSRETLERFNPVTLVQSSHPHWYWIIDKNGCSCGQHNCAHAKKHDAA